MLADPRLLPMTRLNAASEEPAREEIIVTWAIIMYTRLRERKLLLHRQLLFSQDVELHPMTRLNATRTLTHTHTHYVRRTLRVRANCFLQHTYAPRMLCACVCVRACVRERESVCVCVCVCVSGEPARGGSLIAVISPGS